MAEPGDLAKTFEEMRDEIDQLSRSCLRIEGDLEYSQAGGSIYYAVDYSEIFSYCFPYLRLVADVSLGDWSLSRFFLDQIAVSFVFAVLGGQQPLLLLPPYAVELREHLWLLRQRTFQTYETSKQRVLGVRNKWAELEARDSLQAVLGKDPGTLDDDDVEYLIRFVREEFFDVLGLLAAGEQRLGKIRGLVESGKLCELEKAFAGMPMPDPQHLHDAQLMRIENSLFVERREVVRRRHANYLDALAIRYVEVLNEELSVRNSRILIVSRSETMRRAVAAVYGTDRPGSTCIRSLYDVVTRIMHRNHIPANFLQAIRSTREDLEALAEVHELSRTTEIQQFFAEENRSRLRQAVERTKGKLHSRRNLELAMRESRDPLAVRLARDVREQAKEFVNGLLAFIPELEERFETEAADIADELQSERVLLESMLAFGRSDLLDNVRIDTEHFEEGGAKTVLRGRFSSATYTIQFRDPRIMREVSEVVSTSVSGQDVREAIRKVASLRLSSETTSEIHLLVAVFHAAMGNFATAIEELGEGIPEEPSADHRELLYLRSVLRRLVADFKGAFADCELARVLDPGDPRYDKNLGLLIWSNLHLPTELRADVGYTLEDAIEATEAAREKIRNDNRLNRIVLNNLSFYYLEKYDTSRGPDDLASAQARFAQLEKYDESEWEEEFYATRGFLRFHTFLATPAASGLKLMEEARGDIRRALRLRHLPGFVRKLGEEMLVRIEEELPSSDPAS